MSRPKENDQTANETPDPENKPMSGGDSPLSDSLTIEEHQENLNISKPVFAAVMQAEGWAAGKKVPETLFKKAVENFLGAPMGGK